MLKKLSPEKLAICVLISGNGSNLQALIDACQQENYPAEIKLVISNKPDAYGLTRAKQAGIQTQIISHKNFTCREEFDQAMHNAIVASNAQFICMAGFMRLLSPWFVEKWHNKLINIHPSLLPSFKGINAQNQALDAGVKITGCTVHFVRKEMDAGPIIAQEAVNILPGDTPEILGKRILEKEHKCYVTAVELIAAGKIIIKDEKTEIIHLAKTTED